MNIAALRKWLAEPRSELVTTVSQCVYDHVTDLRLRGIEFYGYALLPGEPYDIHSLVAATNSEADINLPHSDRQYTYYRYSVDEWSHYHHDRFSEANRSLVEANEQFAFMHTKHKGSFHMDEFEVAHSNALLDAMVRGLETVKHAGAFGEVNPFLAVWISDSDHPITVESVQQLNSLDVAKTFAAEFG